MSKLYSNVKNVAIIGAGPSGLATAKYLLAEKCFESIDILEQRDDVGGLWNCTWDTMGTPVTVPQVNANVLLEEPVWTKTSLPSPGTQNHAKPVFVSPIYDKLETNIPTCLMQYHDTPFPRTSGPFLHHELVHKYLQDYARDLWHIIHFNTQVVEIQVDDCSHDSWLIKSRDIITNVLTTTKYDAVVVATGHFNVPYLPAIRGIEEWHKYYPGIITHSKFFRSPTCFKGKKVVIVGNSVSGLDIGTQIKTTCKLPLLQSQEFEPCSTETCAWKIELPQIAEFLSPSTHERAIRFSNGRVEDCIDAIVFCTGYLYSFPFLSSLEPSIISDGMRVQHTYKHLFYIEHPTLAFLTLPQPIAPFPLAEAQAAVLSRVWSGRLPLPGKEEMLQWEQSLMTVRGVGKRFHSLSSLEDVEYINEFHDWSARAAVRDGKGKEPPIWREKERWIRSQCPNIKAAYASLREGRYNVRTIEELGFDFEKQNRLDRLESTCNRN